MSTTPNLGLTQLPPDGSTHPETIINANNLIIDSAIAFTVGPLTDYTPTITAGSGTFTAVSAVGKYKQFGKMVLLRIKITITTNGTAAVDVIATIPFAAPNDFHQILTGIEGGITGNTLQAYILQNTSVIHIRNYNATYPGGTGNVLYIEGVYESV